MENPKKSNSIIIRVTEDEKIFITNQAKFCGMTTTDYLVSLSKRKNVIIADGLPKLTVEVSRIGNNINQIATICNTQKYINKQLADLVLEHQNELLKLLTAHYNLIFSQIKNDDVINKNEKLIKNLDKEVKEIKEILLEMVEEKNGVC